MKILVIDRETTNRMIMTVWLQDLNHEVTESMSCAEGLQKLETKKFDIVITDLRTSEPYEEKPTGFDVVQKVKNLRKDGGKTRVILSANTLSEDDQSLCLLHQPDAFLQKPLEQSYFRVLIRAMLTD